MKYLLCAGSAASSRAEHTERGKGKAGNSVVVPVIERIALEIKTALEIKKEKNENKQIALI